MLYTCWYYDARTGARRPSCEFNRALPSQAPPGEIIKAVPSGGGDTLWLDEEGILSGPPAWMTRHELTVKIQLDVEGYQRLAEVAKRAGCTLGALLKKLLHEGTGVAAEAITVTSPEG